MVDFITNFKEQNKKMLKEINQIGKSIKKGIVNSLESSVYTGPLAPKPKKIRQGKGSPGTDYSGFNSTIHKSKIKRIKPGNITKGAKGLYKPSKVGEDSPKYNSKKGKEFNFSPEAAPKGNYGDVRQITEDTKYGGMQKNKQGKLKTPKKVTAPKQEENKKRFRAGPTMASMGGMRRAGKLRGRDVK